jgi:hypothetical protein
MMMKFFLLQLVVLIVDIVLEMNVVIVENVQLVNLLFILKVKRGLQEKSLKIIEVEEKLSLIMIK